ncbi:alpha-N-acetylglucosaminidase [Paenibacillus sp. J2TS4]|uniref:alpha-N-acetylglucosaminidase n=1 Tax=Paenibacillus sp. J2TS4 TaxID=2807194 RepID=UPI001B0AAD96|nr:alpha-N-acetylglucosaminidase [Paenibacillus sp. J2TS4]GIP31644.1 alpha-N-acetylglucosaminidase [Paenibacillus sp. J2TS4]
MKLNSQAVSTLAERLIGEAYASQLRFELLNCTDGVHRFQIEEADGLIVIRGTTPVAQAAGFHWYLKYCCRCSISWCGDQLKLPATLPRPETKIEQSSPYRYVYAYNFVTYSYTTAFWDWARWERELDWMALNGINLVLEMTGHEEVWRRTFAKFGYTDEEIRTFLSGPAYLPFQWLGCLYGWGGPLPPSWFDDRVALAHRIHARMAELGMTRILPGYTGIVPPDFANKMPGAVVLDQGKWVEMERPPILRSDSSAFDLVAQTFYKEQEKLFGTDHFYAADPFHEGGNTGVLDLSEAMRRVQDAMLKADPQAVWVLQGWWQNPTPEMFAGLNKDQALILDLWGEQAPRWKRAGENVFYGTPWIWSFLHNFGGRLGLYGHMKGAVDRLLEALHHPDHGRMCGIGLTGEGIGQNPVIYDLILEMAWRTEVDVDDWLERYVERRYGGRNANAMKAWKYLEGSVYSCSRQIGPTESIINARPSEVFEKRSANQGVVPDGETAPGKAIPAEKYWEPDSLYYDPSHVAEACRLLYAAFDELHGADPYLYDLVDVTRQMIADRARTFASNFLRAYHSGDVEGFNRNSKEFLTLLADQEELLNTRGEFLLGRWLEQAKRIGRSENEKRLYEFNARTLITLWSNEAGQSFLHEYAHRDWAGLTADFYLPRWRLFIAALDRSLTTGEPPEPIDWYAWEYNWTIETKPYPTEPSGDIRSIVGQMIEKLSSFSSSQSQYLEGSI